ncbi:Rrf2 family transcriptional regulator [Magnetofaba australis]|uniref:Putative BadM/Rrf2 family transcriptional regulator n=1 Tax=Magnetofaba australis IT-1 TaxID=1434232 RepID=A0A1Y2K368_9PROT|nr:Rrf2 family transcriptional regulator [Magnetofaba australis]OSM02402.1 putative BadM/Rrf2 family transcriptional regulator [Magnetofaba australis IT-1]
MKLTTRGRYAVTAMLDLAQHGEEGPSNLADISARQEISLSYLEQLFAKLRRSGLVKSIRGPGGGYQLAHTPQRISVADIIRAVDEPIQATSCKDYQTEGCRKTTRCITHDLWVQLGNHIYDYLDSVNLAHLAQNGSAMLAGAHDHDHGDHHTAMGKRGAA